MDAERLQAVRAYRLTEADALRLLGAVGRMKARPTPPRKPKGPPRKLTPAQEAEVRRRLAQGEKPSHLRREFGLGASTTQRLVAEAVRGEGR